MNKNNDLARGAPSARADTTRYTAVAKGLHWLQDHPGTVSAAVAASVVPPGVHVGRNDPCPCGSGKKYKQCHGKLS